MLGIRSDETMHKTDFIYQSNRQECRQGHLTKAAANDSTIHSDKYKTKKGSRKRETNGNFFMLLCVKRNSIFMCIVLVTVISPVEFGLQSFRNRLTVSYDFNQLILDPFFDDRISRIYPKFQLVKRIMSRFVYDPRSINVT